MRAARWDTTWERDGLWRRVLRRRLPAAAAEPIPWPAPARMQVFRADGTVLVEITGTLANDDTDLILARTSEETGAVTAGRYRHRVLAPNPDLDDDEVLLRGYVTVDPPAAAP